MLTCSELKKRYEAARVEPFEVEKLVFEGVGKKDVYNITAPFMIQNERVIAGRVEARDSEASEIHFFVQKEGKWIPKEDAMVLQLQDPFFTFVDDEIVVGGVQTFQRPDDPEKLAWRTVFYKGTTLSELKEFFAGSDGMKDLRLVKQQNGKIGIFTRPQGEKGGRGKIGYACVNSLEDLSVQVIENAPLLTEQFTEEEWGGCNEIHVLKDGTLGILGHVACFDEEGNRHYYSMTFRMNAETGEKTDLKLLAVRSDFLPSEAKRSDLEDVVFSGGLVRHSNKTATLYAGISDAAAQCIMIPDPFAGL